MRITRRIAAAATTVAIIGTLGAAASAPAGAAGMTTHAWMAESGIDLVSDPALEALLAAHVDQVRSGARFPDGGYGPGNVYGEEAHWQRYTDVLAGIIRDKEGCGDLTAPTGPCAAQIAHLMGIVAHGTGDEVWDWLFEPNSPDLDEYYLPEELAPFQDGGGQELVMDLVAIGVHDRPGATVPALPHPEDLLAAFEASGQAGVTRSQLDSGQQYIGIVYQVESAWVATHLAGVQAEMPWMSANMVTAPGGVDYAARAIAGQWDDMWARLLGQDPTSEISATYPADGQTDIPASGWVRSYQPGSHPGRGGARTRISASVTYALPYRHPGGQPVTTDALPAGSMTITERDTGAAVPLMAGYPRVVPYGADAGTHTIDVQPAADLEPCTWYRVDTTTALLDADGQPVAPHSWEFRTTSAVAETACPAPATPDELWVRAAYRDVLEREAGDAEVDAWVAQLGAGLSPGRFANAIVGSAESRRRLAGDMYRDLLDRQPDGDGLAYWTDQLRTTTLTSARARLLGTPEAFALAGGTDATYIDHLYQLVLERAASPEDVSFWAGRLGAGTPRGTLAKQLLGTPEARQREVGDTYRSLLDRSPDASELTYWSDRMVGSDERPLVKAILASDGYRARAQA